MHPGIPIALVFAGCCSNVVFLEYLMSEYSECGNMVTFAAFLFNCLEGLILTTRFLTKSPAIPLKSYVTMVSFFFIVQSLNNYTFAFNIPMPLHMIFRAGSLIANLILGVIILKRRYKNTKYLSVMMITVGIITCTIASAKQKDVNDTSSNNSAYDNFMWLLGLALLVLSLFLSARMGIFQEQTYAKHGKHSSEALFYNHFLPLPGFVFLASSIGSCTAKFSQSAPVVLPVLGFPVPWAWVMLAFNTITQFVCIKSVFILTTECSSLSVTLVVTLRKFVSLVFSILYFKNPFTTTHWFGAVMVFAGTLVFVDVFSRFESYRKLEAVINREKKRKD